jgi:hypothetical protein
MRKFEGSMGASSRAVANSSTLVMSRTVRDWNACVRAKRGAQPIDTVFQTATIIEHDRDLASRVAGMRG